MWRANAVPLDSQRRVCPDDQSFRTALTPAERMVAQLLDEGKRPIEIARLRGTSIRTVQDQIYLVRQKRVAAGQAPS